MPLFLEFIMLILSPIEAGLYDCTFVLREVDYTILAAHDVLNMHYLQYSLHIFPFHLVGLVLC